MQAKAYVVDSQGAPFVLRDVLLDSLQPSEVLVEIKFTGLCHTDIVVQQGGMPVGGYPAVLGHEGAGIVRQVGSGVSDKSLAPGDTVILSFHTCRKCQACQDGQFGGCPSMTEVNFTSTARGQGAKPVISLPDGTPVHGQFFGQSSLSKLAVVSENCIVKVNGHMDDGDLACLAPLGCGYLTGAGTVFNALKPRTTDKLAVLGVGAVGIAAILAAKALGVETIVAVDIVDAKLQTALALGATHIVNSRSAADLETAIKAVFPLGVDKIVDTTGVTALLGSSIKALSHGGTLALVGIPPATERFEINGLDMLLSCKKVIGVIEGYSSPQELIPRLVQLYRDGKFPVDKIYKMYPAEELERAIGDIKSGKVIKPVLSWHSVG